MNLFRSFSEFAPYTSRHNLDVQIPLSKKLLAFNDNLATGSTLIGAILSCHDELSKYNNARKTKKTNGNAKPNTLHC